MRVHWSERPLECHRCLKALGTNWMLEIVNLIHTKGDPSWVKTVLNWKRSPWIEIQEGFHLIKNQKDPRSYNSHLPIQLFPKSFCQSKAKDLRASVERISQFLGMKLSPEEVNSVVKNVSFQAMRENKMSNYSQAPDKFIDHSRGEFLRKGITGDWKNHFTVAQSEAFDKVYQEKMAGLPQGLFPWD